MKFRSTEDLEGLSPEDYEMVSEISEMLFLQNSLRAKSATYTLIDRLPDVYELESKSLEDVRAVQSLFAYCYASPHPAFGNVFLPLESADILSVTPEMVSDFVVWPEHHGIDIEPEKLLPIEGPPSMRNRRGYRGYRNFVAPFWVTKGCRIYPSVPHPSLNISQDMSVDLNQISISPTYEGLLTLIEERPSDFRTRILTAVSWFNRTTATDTEESTAIIQLAVAFEALLQLPQSEKTDRFVDAVSMLLGRVERLDIWARQFYDLRSQIAHEGRAIHTRYVVRSTKNSKEEGSQYHSILLFGRQVFQCCVSAIVFGEQMARKNNLGDRLFTNGERLTQICKVLSDESRPCEERLGSIRDLVYGLHQYQFVPETGLRFDSMAGAVRLVCRCLLNSNVQLRRFRKEDLAKAANSKDAYQCFEAVEALQNARFVKTTDPESDLERMAGTLFWVVWHYSFMSFYGWKREREKKGNEQAEPTGK